ncbi:single-stranded DNA-binding protein [Staphylococcus schweitzeri]|uniref:single-stranded DNA-binding protein n=1 Tax=Staphylococcus schweitzeri TaxID=1654388 RepID=UPI000504256A|nr:single-stranded DNA-binding protein [Staphylococcus schweitzeri]CDR67480.1 Single-stranded DNA-binding protein [Staphylococcus schweitzeri]
MLNKIVIVGRITKDVQIFEKEERKVATFCVATQRNYKDKNGDIVCDYIFCKAFGKLASNIDKYTNQGTLVGITGQMRSRKYDKDGQTHFVTELYVETIKFMSPKSLNNEILSDNILDIDSHNLDNPDLLEI